MFSIALIYLGVGTVSGMFAGLFGVGGGLIIVRGASGALWPTIRSSGVEFPAEASLFLAGARARGVEGRGPARRASREPRQDRKVAAAAGRFLVLRSASPEPAARNTREECCRSRVHGHTRSSRSERRSEIRRSRHGGGFLRNILVKVFSGFRVASGGQKPVEADTETGF